jgi:hypothetical protein
MNFSFSWVKSSIPIVVSDTALWLERVRRLGVRGFGTFLLRILLNQFD